MNLNKVIFITVLVLIALLIGASIYNAQKPIEDYRTDVNYPAENVATTTATTSVGTTTKPLPPMPASTNNGRVMGPVEVAVPMYKIGTSPFASIRLNSFVADYRCPVDVQCIQAGAIVANVTMKVGDKEVTRNFPSDEVPFEFEGVAFSIVDVKPDRKSNEEVAEKDYVITFKMEPLAKGDNI